MFLNRERAYEIMAAHNLNGLVASRQHNVTYLTGYDRKLGFTVSWPTRAILARDPAAPIVLIIPPVELTTVAAQSVWADEIETNGEFWVYTPPDRSLTPVEASFQEMWAEKTKTTGVPQHVLERTLKRLGMNRGRVAFDETGVGYALRESCCPELIPLEGTNIFREIRLIKTTDEIELVRQSTRINEEAGRAMYDACVPGAAWDEIVRTYAVELARRDAVQQFMSSAPGQESSMIFPLEGHGIILKVGEWVRHDYGGTYHSYWSDTGRTISLGEPSEQLRSYYAACRAGLEAVAEQLKPGARSGDLFALGVRTVRQAGIPHYDRAHCGHCIGLEMYETGGIKPNDELRLAPGMVLNVELPYYELGWGGLQIEDTFLITATGAERLTAFPRELIIH